MKKYFIGMVAAIIAMALAVGTSAFSDSKKHHHAKASTEYYFQFMGTHGNESNTSLWQELSAIDYDNLNCPGQNAGCKITSSSVTGTVPNRRPSSVPVDANSKPTITGNTLDAEYKN